MVKEARKFTRTRFVLEVLEEGEGYADAGMLGELLCNVLDDCIVHFKEESLIDCIVHFNEESLTALTPKEAAQFAIEAGSEPEFFELDADGNDLEEEA